MNGTELLPLMCIFQFKSLLKYLKLSPPQWGVLWPPCWSYNPPSFIDSPSLMIFLPLLPYSNGKQCFQIYYIYCLLPVFSSWNVILWGTDVFVLCWENLITCWMNKEISRCIHIYLYMQRDSGKLLEKIITVVTGPRKVGEVISVN